MLDLFLFFFLFLHFFSGILWWGITFFIIFIIRPKNTNGKLSFILPIVQKYVFIISTITITSGIFLMFGNTSSDLDKLLNSVWGTFVLVGGIFSIPSYLRVLFTFTKQNTKPNLFIMTNRTVVVYLPYVLFGLLTISILLMFYTSQLL